MLRNKYYFTGSQGPQGPGISGPVTSTDNEIVRFLGVQGDSIKRSFWIQDDNGFVYNKDGDSLLKLSNSNAPTFCTFIGNGAGTQDPSDYLNTSYNTFIGALSGLSIKNGSNNTAIGFYSLPVTVGPINVCVLIGDSSLQSLVSGSSNVAIGFSAGAYLQTGSNNIYIFNTEAITSESNKIRLSNGQHSEIFINGIYNNMGFNNLQVYNFNLSAIISAN
jgi:hypothetical protein